MDLINDRDLLRIEPSVFTDAAAAGAVLAQGDDGVVDGTSLTSAGSDFEAAGVEAGHVVLIDGVPAEVVQRVSATTLTISRPRLSTADPPLSVSGGSDQPFVVRTFTRLIESVEAWTLGALGLEGGDPAPAAPAASILNVADVQRIMGLRVIRFAFATAAAHDPSDESLDDRASLYRQLAGHAMHLTSVRLDLDGDGAAEVVRRMDVLTLRRT